MKLREMVLLFAQRSGLPDKTVNETARRLQKAGLIKTGKPGRYGGSAMDENDASALLIALLAQGSRRGVTGAVEAVQEFGDRKIGLILPHDLSGDPSIAQPFGLGPDHTFRDLVSSAIRNWRLESLAGRGPFQAFEFSISFPSQKAEVSYYLRDPQPNLVVQYGPPPIMRDLYELKGVFADHFLVGLHRELYAKAKDQAQHHAGSDNGGADE